MKALQVLWEKAQEDLDLQAGLFCSVDRVGDDLLVLIRSAYGLDEARFNGSDNYAVIDVVKDCLKVSNQAHEHSIKNFALSNLIGRSGKSLHAASVVLFSKYETEGVTNVFLGFPQNNKRSVENIKRAFGVCSTMAELVGIEEIATYNADRLTVMEKYVREIGHDFAQNVQALTSKLSILSKEVDLSPGVSQRMLKECLLETKSAYAIADGLGVAVDRQFEISKPTSVELNSLFERLCSEYQADAKEHGITIEAAKPRSLHIYVDEKSFALALGNMLINAIKYAISDTYVEIGYRVTKDELVIFVKNKGIGLPRNNDRSFIWDFGWRSQKAKKMNVNGSGIGLYSCKKIILAHGGRVWEEEYGSITIFSIGLPTNRYRAS